MQCANIRKRSVEAEVEPRSCRTKRVCLEAELRPAECPMETSHIFTASNQHQEQQVGAVWPRPALTRCPRCLGGEPGHFNHIMGH